MEFKRDQLRDRCDVDKHRPTKGKTATDMMHITLITRRSQQSRILQAPLYRKENRIPAAEFVFFWRYYLGLPRLQRKGRAVKEMPASTEARVAPPRNNSGWVEEVCALNHGTACGMGPNGEHEIHCPSTFTARNRAHTLLRQAVQVAVTEIGGQFLPEPRTHDVLLNEFTEEEVKGLCPKTATRETKRQSMMLQKVIVVLASLPPDHPKIPSLTRQIRDYLVSIPKDTKGVRLDLAITLPDGTEIWVDFTGIHPTSKGALAALPAFLRACLIGDESSSGVGVNNPMGRVPSPAVTKATTAKYARYRMMMELAGNQVKNRKRKALPKLVPAVMTHTGELGPEFISLIETLTNVAAKQFRKGPLTRGISRARHTAIYRTKLKDALLCANATGFGQALIAAGNPIRGWILSPVEDWELPEWDVNNY
jgi:hypothetical protein